MIFKKIEKVVGLQQSAGSDYVISIDYNSNLLKKYEEYSHGEIRPKFSISKPVQFRGMEISCAFDTWFIKFEL